ncbi:MAG: hypothetical protein ABI955_09515, partial [Nitrospirota bacterium]
GGRPCGLKAAIGTHLCGVVQDTIRPDTVGPHFVFLESAFKRFAFAGVVGQVAERFLDSFADSRIEGLNIFDGLKGEPDLLH